MSHDNLHITFYFAGEHLHAIPAEQLGIFYDQCATAVSSTTAEKNTELKFQNLSLFPPTKNNLIVAEFAASPALQKLQQQISRLAQTVLGISIDKSMDDVWLPHCTLGKIRAPKKAVCQVGGQMIENTISSSPSESIIESINSIESISVPSIELNGLIPRQRWFEWNLFFASSKRDSFTG